MIRDIFLYGVAGRMFGSHFRLDIDSPAEAVRALVTLRPGLREVIRNGNWRVVVGARHVNNSIAEESLFMSLGSQPVHLIPTTRARGGGGVGKIVAGVVLIGAVILTAGLAAPAGVGLFAAMGASIIEGVGITFANVAMLGVSMVLTGVAALLSTQPGQDAPAQQATDMARPEDRPSFLFNGIVNNSQQGGPVPLVFGRHLVGSIVVSAGINAEDISPLF